MLIARVETPLKQVLVDEGRSQAWLARRLTEMTGQKIHRPTVSCWCNGIHEPVEPTKVLIAQALSRTVDELFPTNTAASMSEAA